MYIRYMVSNLYYSVRNPTCTSNLRVVEHGKIGATGLNSLQADYVDRGNNKLPSPCSLYRPFKWLSCESVPYRGLAVGVAKSRENRQPPF